MTKTICDLVNHTHLSYQTEYVGITKLERVIV